MNCGVVMNPLPVKAISKVLFWLKRFQAKEDPSAFRDLQ
jgi:hypothetical protein